MSTSLPPIVPPPAFTIIRGRSLIWRWVLSSLFAGVVLILTFGMDVSGDQGLAIAVVSVLSYGVFLLLIWRLLRRAKLKSAALFGKVPSLGAHKRYAALPVLLFGTSYVSFFLFFLPVFYFAPSILEPWWETMTPPSMIDTRGNWYWLGNLFNLVFVVGIAPVVEEFVFRGLLLTRWAHKWGVRRGVLASSILFGIVHGNLLGMVFFAVVMSLLYIETRSLFVPMSMHALNNGLAWFLGMTAALANSDTSLSTEYFASQLPTALLLSALFVPWAIYFLSRHLRSTSLGMPYGDASGEKADGTP